MSLFTCLAVTIMVYQEINSVIKALDKAINDLSIK